MQPRTAIKITPADHGKRMSLKDFELALVQQGYNYELGRGVIIVSDVPDLIHAAQVDEIRQQLAEYRAKHREQIYKILEGSSCKVLVTEAESERHPDVAIYKAPPKEKQYPWPTWVPDIAIEVVSASSVERDYVEKKEEYLNLGIREYWIVDVDRQELSALRRRGEKWVSKAVQPGENYHTKLLPGFALDVAAVFKAAEGS